MTQRPRLTQRASFILHALHHHDGHVRRGSTPSFGTWLVAGGVQTAVQSTAVEFLEAQGLIIRAAMPRSERESWPFDLFYLTSAGRVLASSLLGSAEKLRRHDAIVATIARS